jgi:hypothetical protein
MYAGFAYLNPVGGAVRNHSFPLRSVPYVRRVVTETKAPLGSGIDPFHTFRAIGSAVWGTSAIARRSSARINRILTGAPAGTDCVRAWRNAASRTRGEGKGVPATSIAR